MTKCGLAVGLGPLGSVTILLNGHQDQRHSPCLTDGVVTPSHSGQAQHLEPLEDLKLCCDTSLTNQGLGNSTSGSGMTEAAGVGLALAGAQEPEEVHH